MYQSLRKVKKVTFKTWLELPPFISLSPAVMLSDCPRIYERTKQHKMTSNICPEAYNGQDKETEARKGQRTRDWRIQNIGPIFCGTRVTRAVSGWLNVSFSQTQSIKKLRLEPANSGVCIVQLWYLEKKKKHKTNHPTLVAAHTRSVIYPGDKYWLSPVCVHNSQCLPGQLLTGDGI